MTILLRKGLAHDMAEPEATEPDPTLCGLCGVQLTPATEVFTLVPDSSAVHPYNADLDGMRRLGACSPDHLGELQQHYRQRPYIKEELWAGKIARALRLQPDLDKEELSEVTDLNFLQIERSLTWESERFLRDTAPGGEGTRPEGGPHNADGPS
ncbi:hypothetical protein [Streptomyces sp. NPDC059008]|uniref:hypothetical protein n=1 Tax=Streptomyces sp. NPDC059008 TaxID=3346693 RepID=UPI0036C38519